VKVLSLVLVSAVIATSLGGCAHKRVPIDPSIHQVTDLKAVPAPDALGLFQQEQPYRIGPLDTLTYSVYGVPGLEGDLQVDSGGRISIPLVGTVMAAGKTPQELSAEVTTALRAAHVRDPHVAINPRQINSQFVTVDGAVAQPGNYQPVPNMTLLRAIAAAKGLNDYAKASDVIIFRTVDGRDYAAVYNLGAIRQGGYPDPRIYANDRIVVGESANRRLFKDLLQIGPAFITPLIYVLTR
jgi:polysaccharide export outer membrane protein